MEKSNRYIDYCTGCGLCESELGIKFSINEKGYSVPNLSEKDFEFCEKVCPCGGKNISSSTPWGDSNGIYYAWSNDAAVRKLASSGGVITSLCIYLIENHIVDGIIQTRACISPVYETETIVSSNVKEIKSCMGSRYSISRPIKDIHSLIQPGKRYAFVGKPCDVAALRAYMNINETIKKSIVYLFSFFCAGMPSVNAQKELMAALNVNENDCKCLQYRGNGWPGYATAICNNNISSSITYDESWGKILGRDVRRICRFCFDGIGLSADISCGDAWYLGDDGKPDFSEGNGRNVVFLRSEKGKEIFERCLRECVLCGERQTEKDLKYIQKYQYERRTTMIAKIAALYMERKTIPSYSYRTMIKLARRSSLRRQLSIFKGTLERCKSGKI
jgi:Coenzyme F420-reducing hydrogenase, beta subunit